MGLLPCIRRGSDRWWLPRSAQATEALGHLMLSSSRGAVDTVTRQRLLRAIESDPPLLIFASLNWTGDRVETGELVDWFSQHVIGRFASGDAFLSAPPISSAMEQRWKKLNDHFRTLPIGQWLNDAALWLEVTGPKVSNAWQQQWPQVTKQSNGPIDLPQATSNCMLQQLARSVQRQHSLERSFDQRLQKTKLGAIKELAYGLEPRNQ